MSESSTDPSKELKRVRITLYSAQDGHVLKDSRKVIAGL